MYTTNDEVAIFAPYKELYDICKKCVNDKNLDWNVELVNSNNVYNLGKFYKDNNYKLIISRGGIAKTLENEFNFEVINIHLSKEKILETLYKYRNSSKKIAVIENYDFIKLLKSINKILKVDLLFYQISSIDEYPRTIDIAHNDGVEVIIGGSYGLEITETINRYNIKYELINSDIISVKEAIYKANTFLKGKQIEYESKKLLESIIEFYPKGMIYIDANKKVQNVNNYAKRFFDNKNIIGLHISSIFNDSIFDNNEDSRYSVLANISNKPVMLDIINLDTGYKSLGSIIAFQNENEIIQMENKIRKNISSSCFSAKYTFDSIVGNSKSINKSKRIAKTFSEIDTTILITGETGTGKEVFAQAIHNNSLRRNENFVAINCSALPNELLESELFGYKEGAFTGSRKGGKIGLIELAHNGTLFLDEIGEMDITLQSKLLRVISEQEIIKIGDNQVIPVNIRIIAATNRNLLEEIEKGNFRRDLYYRLNVMSFELPPLRNRKSDIPLLINKFISTFNKKFNTNIINFSDDLMEEILQYDWPGNIRELQNFVEKCVAVSKDNYITQEKINIFNDNFFIKKEINNNMTLKEFEKKIINDLLEKNNHNKSVVAKILDIDRGTLNRKINS